MASHVSEKANAKAEHADGMVEDKIGVAKISKRGKRDPPLLPSGIGKRITEFTRSVPVDTKVHFFCTKCHAFRPIFIVFRKSRIRS